MDEVSWVAFVAPGELEQGLQACALRPENIAGVRESQGVRPGEMFLVRRLTVAGDEYPLITPGTAPVPGPTHWPDGQPVTPWADPWHDVLGDIRAIRERPMPSGDMTTEEELP